MIAGETLKRTCPRSIKPEQHQHATHWLLEQWIIIICLVLVVVSSLFLLAICCKHRAKRKESKNFKRQSLGEPKEEEAIPLFSSHSLASESSGASPGNSALLRSLSS